MAAAIDDNDTDGQLDKSIWRLLSIRYTSIYGSCLTPQKRGQSCKDGLCFIDGDIHKNAEKSRRRCVDDGVLL